MKYITSLVLLFFLCVSCGEESGKKKQHKPASLGAINNLSVVMETPLWRSAVGDTVRSIFAAQVKGLPWQEPLFNIEYMPQRVFTGTTRHRRAVLFVSLDSTDATQIRTDLYAAPQKIGVVKAPTRKGLIENLKQHADTLVSAFKQQELEEAQNRINRALSKEDVLQRKFGISLKLPLIYELGKEEEDFVWIDREIQKGTMNILAYEMPEKYFESDSSMVNRIVHMRDSIGEAYIPGPDIPGKKTYMITEKAFAPYVNETRIAGHKAWEARGIWEVANYPMAGPFVTYIIDRPNSDKKLVLEGFTFAPATNKRDYMLELEAILKTLEFQKEGV